MFRSPASLDIRAEGIQQQSHQEGGRLVVHHGVSWEHDTVRPGAETSCWYATMRYALRGRDHMSFIVESFLRNFSCRSAKREGLRRHHDRAGGRGEGPVAALQVSQLYRAHPAIASAQSIAACLVRTKKQSRARHGGGPLVESSRDRHARRTTQATVDGTAVRV